MSERILVVVAHSDDEALGCAGTIARHSSKGDEVTLVIMADGVGSRDQTKNAEYSHRRKCSEQCAEILGIKNVIQLDLPDNAMDSLPFLQVVKKLEKATEQLEPAVIYTHHFGDLNIDHRITFQAVMTAFRPVPGSSVKEIYSFEVMSSSDWVFSENQAFIPNCFVDISDFINYKVMALEAYKIEMRPSPYSRNIEHLKALAMHRGNSSGLFFAEAFYCVRKIVQ